MTIFTCGHKLYDAILADIRAAKDRTFFEWFTIEADEVDAEFHNALIEAAQRGVDTYVIIDTWDNTNQDPRFRRLLKAEHLHTPPFSFAHSGLFNGHARDRGCSHRKILTVDKRIRYVGGYNIGILYAHEWRDTHVRIEGPAAWELDDASIDIWNDYRKEHRPAIADNGVIDWGATVHAVVNTPTLNVLPISALYMDAISRSAVRVWVTMGYFILEEPMLIIMTNATRRGVDVRMPTLRYSNHIVGDWAGRPHYEHLLHSGMRIFPYRGTMAHSKTMTVDGRWSTVGTVNIGGLPLHGNFEINVGVSDPGSVAIMECIFKVDLTNPHELAFRQR